ncbi:hypothetical protein BGZ98_008521 [Dissophora globulifera]|nr:hypothetical protein BGZ98_008521 [Dissophora globulifera]
MSMFSNHEMELSTVDRKFQDLADEFLAKSPLQSSTLGSTLGRYSPSSFSTHDAGLSPSYLGNMRRWSGTSDHNQGGFGQETSNERHSRYYDAQIERIKLLIEFFTQEKGFKGNTDNYYDPFNSFIDKVLTRRLGIPISLCIVFSELAHRVGIAGVDLMGFPQHFMVRFRPPAPSFDRASTLSPKPEDSSSSLVPPPTYYLDLFHPPHRLLSTQEYENYFSTLNIPQPAKVYRDLPTPPLEIFLRCLRNIILAVEQTGGAGRWGLYVLWLKYLSTFWPEDVGFIRTSIDDMELIDHRRSTLRGNLSSPSQGSQRQRHMFGYHQGTLHNMTTGPSAYFASSTHETIKILRAQVRELEMMDEAGEVSEIRRRRRPKVTAASPTSSPEVSLEGAVFDQGSPSLTTIDSQSTHSLTSVDTDTKVDEREKRRKERLSAAFGGEERRRPEPLYYVGEVFQHLIYRYTGTIYGYDLKCEADENWIISMGIDSLTHGRKQPFYNALLSDGSRRYVAQENIQVLYRDFRNKIAAAIGADQIHETENTTLAQGSSTLPGTTTPAIIPGAATDTGYAPHRTQFSELGPLEIETVGQYFEAWDGQRGHYVMNKELRKVYPTEDYL